jgi:predicted O-methyltransferase YrrM
VETRRNSFLHATAGLLAGSLAAALPSCRAQEPTDRVAATAPSPRGAAESEPSPGSGYAKPYDFTTDWFSRQIPIWSATFASLRGRPDLRYLEVGVYEGRSLLWMLENVLTHPTSRLTGIDIELRPRLASNIEKSGQAERINMIVGPSQTELRKLPARSFDVIYIDGSHVSADVLADAVLGFELLNEGGLIVFDDYAWVGASVNKRGLLPDQLRPRMAIDAFVRAYRYDVGVVQSGYQMILRRTTDPCRQTQLQGTCSPFGQYLYDWSSERLLVADDPSRAVRIAPAERDLIESVLRAAGPDEKTGRDPAFTALRERLHLELPDLR